jgi:hypothetical protein
LCLLTSYEKNMKVARNQSIASRYILAKPKPGMLSRLFIPDFKTIFGANCIRNNIYIHAFCINKGNISAMAKSNILKLNRELIPRFDNVLSLKSQGAIFLIWTFCMSLQNLKCEK